MTTIEWEVEYTNPATNEVDYMYVDFMGDVVVENDGIGSYEFWGVVGYDHGHDYNMCENIEWDKSLYTDEQNKIIEDYLDENYEKIEEQLCN